MKKVAKTSTLPELAATEERTHPDGEVIVERDRDRANRLYLEVHQLAERLRDYEYPKEGKQPNDPGGEAMTAEELLSRLLPGSFSSRPYPEGWPTIQDKAPETITHDEINKLDDTQGTAAGDVQWERIRKAVHDDLMDGRQARKVLTSDLECNSTPYEELVFTTTYDLLRDEWSPKGISELLILQHMTQAHTLAQFWMQRLTRYSMGMATTVKDEDDRAKYGEWVPPRVSATETVDFCSRQIVRFTNLYLKQIRALRDLRRYNVTINNPGQVNIGEKQINATGDVNTSA